LQPEKIAMCASTVSSKMLAEIARVEGFHFEETLTGFKWIGSRLAVLKRDEGYRPLFGYEEAIGFSCGDVLFDKDGISAMAVFSEMAYWVYWQGSTLKQHMQSIYDKYGEFVSHNGYYCLLDPGVVHTIMDRIRCNGTYKIDVGPYEIESVRDLGEPGYDSLTSDKKPTLPTSKSSPMMTLRFTNGCVAQFRASGTEPKFKYYIEMKGKPGVARDAVLKELETMAPLILEKVLEPSKNGLTSKS
jgi:phosphomannomutase